MIIIKLQGGLGNQIFQYACGRSLALKNKDILKLDITDYERDKKRIYRLHEFAIEATVADQQEIKIAKDQREFLESGANFNQQIESVVGTTYLSGYWQSEKYFSDYKDCIKSEIRLKDESKDFKHKKREILSCESIGLHVRRGDYTNEPKTKAFHGVLGEDYYHRALEYFNGLKDVKVFVFSDDINWVQENLRIPYQCEYVSGNKFSDTEELILLAACKHQIIANSSFSWWGAWLNANLNKIVIAPKNWFANGNVNSKDIIPEKWIKI